MLTWGPTFFENAFSVLKFLKVIFPFILHPLILRKSMCYGSRRGSLPNNTSCHLIAKLRKVIIILGGPTGRSPGSPTGQSAPDWVYIFPSAEFSVYVLTVHTLKSVRRKALAYSKIFAFFKVILAVRTFLIERW